MKWGLYCIMAVCLSAPMATAQAYEPSDHAEVGVFADYFRLDQAGTNQLGVGGRLSVNLNPYVQLEAEMAYDFDQTFVTGYTRSGTGTITTDRSQVRILHGLFGPKLQTNRGPVRLFVTAKGGFINFGLSSAPATPGTFTSTVGNLTANNVEAVFYPGAGAEAFWGPIGGAFRRRRRDLL